eukprot:CAMPEP_0171011790 /NCGR_PEP_ID=MMETSP0736-20130129/23102_1 /TAXON_ID=186038 /ORGANISM="Fragilariopsis kerguelensis, Strain L26-C5" /LENGTH=111 /DNA_ID=CAMNT_0011444613 /DNA_START=194 /DNA_END=525 /DNA_ORIENTATION=+
MIDEQMSTTRDTHKIACVSKEENKSPSAIISRNNETSSSSFSSLLTPSPSSSTMSVSKDINMAMAVRQFKSQHFPTNLHDLLDEAEQGHHSHIVSWCAQGQAFQFHYDDVL